MFAFQSIREMFFGIICRDIQDRQDGTFSGKLHRVSQSLGKEYHRADLVQGEPLNRTRMTRIWQMGTEL